MRPHCAPGQTNKAGPIRADRPYPEKGIFIFTFPQRWCMAVCRTPALTAFRMYRVALLLPVSVLHPLPPAGVLHL